MCKGGERRSSYLDGDYCSSAKSVSPQSQVRGASEGFVNGETAKKAMVKPNTGNDESRQWMDALVGFPPDIIYCSSRISPSMRIFLAIPQANDHYFSQGM